MHRIIISTGLYLLFSLPLSQASVLPPSPSSPSTCGVGDIAPVNLQASWRQEEHCYDLAGNIFNAGEMIRSCHDCLEYTCTTSVKDKCVYYSWVERISKTHLCCQDCDGAVFPPGEVISITNLNDSCSSIKTERCEDNLRGGVFVSRTILPTTCCQNSSGLQPLKSHSLDPAICSVQTCDLTSRHSSALWLVEKEYEGCDCCVYNNTLVPDGWSHPLNLYKNITCCEGDLQETFLPALPHCHIQNLTYLIDTSGSMHSSRPAWEPAALALIDVLVAREVDIVDYTLMDFVTTVHVSTTTSSQDVFHAAVDNLIISGGSRELTFAGIRAALQASSCHNFIIVFTDEIGQDADDVALKSEILVLKSLTKSEIVFLVVSGSATHLSQMEEKFGEIGHVIDVADNAQALKEVVDLMVASEICSDDCPPQDNNTIGRRTIVSEPIEVPWLTILRRGQYGNPVTMFSDATFSQFVAGFGDVTEEFWIGLEKLANITAEGDWELSVELVDSNEKTYVAEYEAFKVEGADKNFKLTVNGHKSSSNLEDSLTYHNGMVFSVKDKNNNNNTGNCSEPHGGWWHNSCFQSNLFGKNLNTAQTTNDGIVWRNDENVAEQNLSFSWPYAEMKIKKI